MLAFVAIGEFVAAAVVAELKLAAAAELFAAALQLKLVEQSLLQKIAVESLRLTAVALQHLFQHLHISVQPFGVLPNQLLCFEFQLLPEKICDPVLLFAKRALRLFLLFPKTNCKL